MSSAILKTATGGGTAKLTLSADSQIDINAAIDSSAGALDLDLISGLTNPDGTIDIGANIDLNGGSFGVTTSDTDSNITQSAGLILAGASSFSTGDGDIALANVANDFSGSLTLLNTGARDITIADANDISISGITMDAAGGILTVNAAGNITDAGTILTGTGAVTFASTGGDIDLDTAANNFRGSVDLTTAGAGLSILLILMPLICWHHNGSWCRHINCIRRW